VTGKRRRLTIGSYPAWTLADARVRARELRRTVEDGGDSIDDAKAKARRLTVAQLVERYLAVIEKTHRDHKRVRRSIERDVLLVLGDRPAEDIKRRDIISILDAIVRRGAPVHANRVRSMLSAMWSWAISEDLVDVEVNPASNIKKRVEEHPGTRWLNADEIKCLGSHLERLPEAKRDALKLILLTGQRPGEVVGIGVARIADLAAIEIYERWATWAAAPSQRSDCAS
jgi:integrase